MRGRELDRRRPADSRPLTLLIYGALQEYTLTLHEAVAGPRGTKRGPVVRRCVRAQRCSR